MKFAFWLFAALLGLGVSAYAATNLPTLTAWEQALLQGLTGPYGVPLALAAGGTPVNSGSCAINTQLGGQGSGSFKANGACAAGTYILTFVSAAPNGLSCDFQDLTTRTDLINETAYTTTTVTATGTAASLDLIVYQCQAF